jgi:hypothetical protein
MHAVIGPPSVGAIHYNAAAFGRLITEPSNKEKVKAKSRLFFFAHTKKSFFKFIPFMNLGVYITKFMNC